MLKKAAGCMLPVCYLALRNAKIVWNPDAHGKEGVEKGKVTSDFSPFWQMTLSAFFVDDAAGSVAETATKQPGHEPAKVKQFLSPSGFNGTDINTWLTLFHGNSRDLSNA